MEDQRDNDSMLVKKRGETFPLGFILFYFPIFFF